MSATFLGFDFQPVRLEHKTVLQDFLRRHPQRMSGYTFATLATWAEEFQFEWTQPCDGCLLISRLWGQPAVRHLLQPIGPLGPECCANIVRAAASLPYPLQILGVAGDFLQRHPILGEHFNLIDHDSRDPANYIYRASDLAKLPGGRYAKKRNLISQFLTLYPSWEASSMSASCGPCCAEILMNMARANGMADDSPSVRAELKALEFTMTNFEELEQTGIMIRIEDKPVAFAVFERLDASTAVVHFEKADRAYKGLYQMINRETAKAIEEAGFDAINREEDMGDEGLRQAKLSYHPIEIYPVVRLVRK